MSDSPFTHLLGSVCILFIRAYQICISPVLGPCCRFTPRCSEYAIDAVRSYGPIKGAAKALTRLLRCHPWHPGGYDPVQ